LEGSKSESRKTNEKPFSEVQIGSDGGLIQGGGSGNEPKKILGM
jgi:hypothetical protein